MPPRRRKAEGQGELFGGTSTKDIQDILWKAADKLRGSIDAAQYKEFVLGLIFVKYVSDAFAERRAAIAKELESDGIEPERSEEFLDDKDEYTGNHVFWVPKTARWDYIAGNAKSLDVGDLLNEAMDAIMGENDALTGVLPKIYKQVDQKRLGELVDLISDARFTGHGDRPAQDVLGEVYEYFLAKFAAAEGKRAGEFYTPASVVRLLVEVLEPYEGRVYDPCCGSGGMFVQSTKFVAAHRGKHHTAELSVYGQELNERTWRLAKMNLAIHGIENNLGSGPADTFVEDRHKDLKADYILANPPFNISDWARKSDDPKWRFGVPPASNANYAWLQHIVSKLGEKGSAGVVLANGSMSSKQSGEGEIRTALVEADLISCMIAMPSQLFRGTQIPACLWFMTKDKGPQGSRKLANRAGEVLFIDARNMGAMIDRVERVLTMNDLAKIAGTYHAWRGTESANDVPYEDVAGYCYSASLEDIRRHDHVLTPGRYVGAAELEDDPDAEPIAARIDRLTKELFGHFDESARLEAVVREQLGMLG